MPNSPLIIPALQIVVLQRPRPSNSGVTAPGWPGITSQWEAPIVRVDQTASQTPTADACLIRRAVAFVLRHAISLILEHRSSRAVPPLAPAPPPTPVCSSPSGTASLNGAAVAHRRIQQPPATATTEARPGWSELRSCPGTCLRNRGTVLASPTKASYTPAAPMCASRLLQLPMGPRR